MKKTIGLLLVLAGTCCGAFAAESDAPAPLSRFSTGAYLSYWNAEDLEHFDLDGAFGLGGLVQYRLANWLALEARLGIFAAADSTDHYTEELGWFETGFSVATLPAEIGLLATWTLGDKVTLYGGPGAGYYFFDGEFRVEQGPWEITTDLDLDHSAGVYALLGARMQLARHVGLFLEGKYTWVETKWRPTPEILGTPPDGLRMSKVDVDFSGVAVNLGLFFTF
ncbi:MAG TPA: outer membrane beta-barrel protein [Kiritimatiellia bacterium]|nr:porin family protein [Lentisphaerota bacterium]HRV30813.1 outer membrane beta-barrel protein [Kiritimatiellia bacterium]